MNYFILLQQFLLQAKQIYQLPTSLQVQITKKIRENNILKRWIHLIKQKSQLIMPFLGKHSTNLEIQFRILKNLSKRMEVITGIALILKALLEILKYKGDE